MKTVLVAGGAGGVGEGIVRALVARGDTAIVPSRSAAKLAALDEYLAEAGPGRLVSFTAHLGEPAGARAVRERIVAEHGRLDVAISSLGGWWEGRGLLDMPLAEWDAVMEEMLRTHVVFAQTFLPLLLEQGGGRYIGIGGGAAYYPIPGSAVISMAAAAQLMMTRALRAEVADPAVDILELVVDGPVNTRPFAHLAEPDWITADEVGAVVAELVAAGRTKAPTSTVNGPIVRLRPPLRSGSRA